METDTNVKTVVSKKVEKMPPWNVYIVDSPDHSFEYVIIIFTKIFGKDYKTACELTLQVHKDKRAIGATCSKERAELYKSQVDGMGPDRLIPHCKGAISCEIEPAE